MEHADNSIVLEHESKPPLSDSTPSSTALPFGDEGLERDDDDDIDKHGPLPASPWMSKHFAISCIALLLFLVLAGSGILVASLVSKTSSEEAAEMAQDLAVEQGSWFKNQLSYAILPLFSLAQFATELDVFRSLPDQIGPAYGENSLPFVTDVNGERTSHRNATGVCDQPELVQRFTEIASAIKLNAGMDGVLINLQLAPEGVICLLHPMNNTEDFAPPMFLDSSSAWGLDLLEDPQMQYIARESLKGEQVGVAGPRPLTQCPECDPFFIARLPVGDKNHQIEIDGRWYPRWGFATALINWKALVERSDVHAIFSQHGYEFQLTRTDHNLNPDTDKYETSVVVLAASEKFGRPTWQRVQTALQTTNNEWILTVEYQHATWWLPVVMVVAILVSAAIAALVYMVLVQKQAHTQMVGATLAQNAKVEIERNMTAYFAHELRNPLSAIDSALEAMPDDLSPSTVNLIDSMKLCSRFMSSIMNNLLDVRKIEEGKMMMHTRPLSLKQLVESVHKMTLPALRPGVAFTTETRTGDRDWVLGDEHRLAQILNNLVMNAIKYTSAGSICLAVTWKGDRVRFECQDSGPGIPREEQEELFERFVMRGGAPGSGLGLAISKQIVELMGGTIAFDSDPTVQPGTNCIVEVPLDVCAEPEEEETTGNTTPIEEPIRIMIVDDIKINRSMLKRRITKCIAPNAIITEASTGEESLSICENETVDVIIVDQYMEGAGGVMLGTDAIIAMRRARIDAVIIGCSGNDLDSRFRTAGADFVWKKPMPSNAEIIQQLRQKLSSKKQQ